MGYRVLLSSMPCTTCGGGEVVREAGTGADGQQAGVGPGPGRDGWAGSGQLAGREVGTTGPQAVAG